MLERFVEVGDRLVKIATGEGLFVPDLNGQAVAYVATVRLQTD